MKNPVLKTCSRCKNDLPIERFNKSPRYFSGRVSQCQGCQKEVRDKRLSESRACSKCKSNPHASGHDYCERCLRLSKGRTVVPKIGRRKTGLHLCAKCKTSPRSKYHAYCRECRNKSVRVWNRKTGGSWHRLTKIGQRRKALSRHLVSLHVRRGKLKRTPCEQCGNPKVQGHHHKGYEAEHATDVRWLCKRCHDEAERILKSLLTTQPLLL